MRTLLRPVFLCFAILMCTTFTRGIIDVPQPPPVLEAAGCTPEQAKTARDVILTAKDLACVFGSALTSEIELTKLCKLADELGPTVRNLIGVREGARTAGVVWLTSDAGSFVSSASDGGITLVEAGPRR